MAARMQELSARLQPASQALLSSKASEFCFVCVFFFFFFSYYLPVVLGWALDPGVKKAMSLSRFPSKMSSMWLSFFLI